MLRPRRTSSGVSPRTALDLGLKVDVDKLTQNLIEKLKHDRYHRDIEDTNVMGRA